MDTTLRLETKQKDNVFLLFLNENGTATTISRGKTTDYQSEEAALSEIRKQHKDPVIVIVDI